MSLASCGFLEFHFVFEVSDGRVWYTGCIIIHFCLSILSLLIGNRCMCGRESAVICAFTDTGQLAWQGDVLNHTQLQQYAGGCFSIAHKHTVDTLVHRNTHTLYYSSVLPSPKVSHVHYVPSGFLVPQAADDLCGDHLSLPEVPSVWAQPRPQFLWINPSIL